MTKWGPACLLSFLTFVALAPHHVSTGLASLLLAKEEWRVFRTPHFEVVSQAPDPLGTWQGEGADEAGFPQNTILRLEQTRALVGQAFPGWRLDPAQPVMVVLFRDQSSLKPYQAGPKGANGYFLPSDDRQYIVVRRPEEESEASAIGRLIIQAELRLILSLNCPTVPPWLEEGLTDFFFAASFEASGQRGAPSHPLQGRATVGIPPAEYLATLRAKASIPSAEFLKIGRDSKYFSEPESVILCRAQAWALVDYLTLGAHAGDGQNAIPTFLELLGQGVDQATALQQIAGMGLEALWKRSSADYPRKILTLPSLPRARDLRARALSEAEALYYEGDLLLHLGRYDAATPKVEAALALDPKLLAAGVARGLLAIQLNRWVEARRRLQEIANTPGADAPEGSYLIHFYYAVALLRQPLNSAAAAPRGATTGDVELAERELRRVIQLRESFGPAYRALASVAMRKGDLTEAQRLAERALTLEPQSISSRLTLAEIQSQKGNFAEAQQTLAPAAASSRLEDKARVAEVLERMKDYAARVEQARKLRAQEAERPHWEKNQLETAPKSAPVVRGRIPASKQVYPRDLPDIQREKPEPPAAPSQPPKYGFVRGKVVEVSCTAAQSVEGSPPKKSAAGKPAQDTTATISQEALAGKRGRSSSKTAAGANGRSPLRLILSIQAKSRTFRFFKEDLSQVAMVSGPEQGSVCESLGRIAIVNYLESAESRSFGTGFSGEVMSVEIAAREKPPVESGAAAKAGRKPARQPKLAVFRGTVEEVSCGRPMIFTLRGKDGSGKPKVLRLRAGSATEFFATATKGTPPVNFNACESKGLMAGASYRPLPPGEPYDGELTRVEFAWTRP